MTETNTVRCELMTRETAAAYLGLRTQTLAAWASSGMYSLPMVMVGRSVRYRKADLDAWLESRVVTAVQRG